MSTKLAALPRVFMIGALKLRDPLPGRSLSDSVRMLSRNFPQFRVYKLYEEDGVVIGNELAYTIENPPAKDNG
jgi:hypothetical protein